MYGKFVFFQWFAFKPLFKFLCNLSDFVWKCRETVLLIPIGRNQGGKSLEKNEGEVGAGVGIGTGGEDTKDTGDILRLAVIQVCWSILK